MTGIKKGDRVKVTTETEYIVRYASVYREGYDLETLEGSPAKSIEVGHDGVVKVEKVDPPVEVFKPGDVVRSKRGEGTYFIRENGGFINLTAGKGREWDYRFEFTSEYYEKVDLSAVS